MVKIRLFSKQHSFIRIEKNKPFFYILPGEFNCGKTEFEEIGEYKKIRYLDFAWLGLYFHLVIRFKKDILTEDEYFERLEKENQLSFANENDADSFIETKTEKSPEHYKPD